MCRSECVLWASTVVGSGACLSLRTALGLSFKLLQWQITVSYCLMRCTQTSAIWLFVRQNMNAWISCMFKCIVSTFGCHDSFYVSPFYGINWQHEQHKIRVFKSQTIAAQPALFDLVIFVRRTSTWLMQQRWLIKDKLQLKWLRFQQPHGHILRNQPTDLSWSHVNLWRKQVTWTYGDGSECFNNNSVCHVW